MSSRTAVLITEPDDYAESAIATYRQLGDVWLGEAPAGRETEVGLLVVRLAHRIDTALLDRFPRLKAVVTPTTGLDHVDLGACEARNIRVFSLADCREAIDRVTSTSELALGLILALLRRLPEAHRSVIEESAWDRDRFRSRQLSNLTVGIAGLGRTGGHLASYLAAIDTRVVAFDPNRDDSQFSRLGVERMELDEMLRSVDVLSINANLTPETAGLIGEREIDLLQPHALIVNTARGALLDEGAAARALIERRIGGVAVDVLPEEGEPDFLSRSPLVEAARNGFNVLITPHIGGCTSDAMHHTEAALAQFVLKALGTGRP